MQKFLRLFVMAALLFVPWITRAQNANVSEYDYEVTTANFASIAQTGTVWTAAEQQAGQVDVTMPFNMYLGTSQIASGSTMSVYADGSVAFSALAGARIAPLYYAAGYQTGETSVYYRTTTTMIAVEWRKVVSGSNVYSFQLKLYNDNHVEFCYGPMTINSSLSVLVGLMSSDVDIFRCGGTDWSVITRYTSGLTTRTLSTTSHPEYNVTTGQGLVYTFTQPSCVKPSSLTANATAWNAIDLAWTINDAPNRTGFQVKYSDNSDFDPENEGQVKNVSTPSATSTNITGLMGSTTYYFYLRSVCGSGNYSAWSPMASATTPNGCPNPTNLDVTSTGIVTWTGIANATTYDVKYGVSGFDPLTEGTAINGIAATTTTVPSAGFPSQTTVDVYVRAYCSTVNGTYTDWVGPVSFVTPCAPLTVDESNFYTQTFGDYTLPQCWSEEIITGATSWDFASGYAHFSYTPGASARLVSPTFNLNPAGNYQVEFYHAEYDFQGGCDSLWLYYRTSPTAAWIRLGQYGNHSSNLLREVVILPTPTTTYQLAFVSEAYDYLGMAFANVVVRTQPTCPEPTNVAATNEGVVTWTANTNNTSYDLVYGPAGFTSVQEGTVVENINGTTYTITGLTPGNYDVYVRAHCSATNEVSEGWAGPASFTKAKCNNPCTYTLSLVDSYGDGWNGGQVNVYVDGVLNTYTIEDGNSAEYQILVCPTEFLEFVYVAGGYADENSFTLTGYNGSTVYTCTSGSDMTSGAVFFSEYACGVEPTCPVPHIASATDAGVITWAASSNASSYEIKYGPAGFNVETEGTLVQNLTGTTYTITGLEAMTSYDVYLRAVCASTSETSNWTSASFTTSCVPLPLPYAEDFESYTGGSGYASAGCDAAPQCWVVSPTDVSYGVHIGTQGAINGKGLVMTAGTSSCKPNNIAVLPAFNRNVSQLMINFDYKMESASANVLTLGYVTNVNDTSSFVPLTICPASTSVTHFEYAFAGNTIPDGARIAFQFYRSSSYYWVNIDNVVVEALPSCFKPQALNLVTATENTATIGWTEVSGATTWNVLYGPQGFDPATEGTQVAVTSNPATISGLTGNTVYDVYVQSVCIPGEDISEWSSVYSFRTACPATTALPYADDFSGYTITATYPYYAPSVAPACWDYYSNGTNTADSPSSNYYGGVGKYNGTSYGSMVSNNPYLCMPIQLTGSAVTNTSYINYGVQRGSVKYAIFPAFDQPLNNIMVSFDYKMSTAYSATGAAARLELGYVTNGDTSTFQVMETYNAVTSTQHIVELPLGTLAANAPAGARLAFRFTGVHNGTGTSSYTTVYCGIDNIFIRQMPNCVVPGNVTAAEVTNSTALITWTELTNPAATNWTLKYGPAGFDPENAGTAIAVSTTPSYEITGLTPFVIYDVYVRAECSVDETSEWSDAVTFRTTCPDGGSVDINGNSASTSYYLPSNMYFNYSYTQQIISADEIPGATNIEGISFNYAYGTPNDPAKEVVDIYIGITDKSSFASSSDFVDPATLTLVYSGPLACVQGWNDFNFTTPFAYSGTGNIVIAVDENASSYSGSAYIFNTETTDAAMSLSYYSDSYNPDATSASTLSAFSGSKTTYSYRNKMRLIAACNTEVTCFAPASVSTEVTPANVVTVNWAHRTDLRPIVDNYELKYGPAGFDPETAGTLVSDLNNVFTYTISEQLAADAEYDVYVRTVCGETEHSNWTMASFTTNPSCWIPTNVTVSNATETSLTLAWTENTPAAATRWEIAYGEQGFDPNNTAKANYVETTNNLNYVLSGLHHSTVYDIYVRAICSTTDYSDWSVVAQGITACGVLAMEDLPLFENFDGYVGKTSGTLANHVLPRCWDYNNDATSTSYVGYPICYNSSSYSRSGNNHLRFYTNYSSNATSYGDQIAILPAVNFDVDTLNLEFYARKYSTSTSYQSNILVGVMSDPEDAATFELVATLHPSGTTYEPFVVEFGEYQGNGRYIAIKAERIDGTSGYNYVLIDDLTLKVRETINTLANNGGNIEACNAFVTLDTVGGTYAGNLNATYVVKPATAGKVAHLTGEYDMENGYDFINIYRGTATAANLIGTYTGAGSIDLMTSSNNWVDSGFFTIVVTSDADNALNNAGFKFLVSCECPAIDTNIIVDQVEANGTYTWTAGNNQTYNNHSTNAVAIDVTAEVDYTLLNVAQCDSANRHLSLVLHPDYTINYGTVEICQGENYEFYDTVLATTGNYTVTMQNTTGADSTGIITLQVNPLPTVTIKYNNEEVTSIDNFCDNFDMELVASSNLANATYLWEDSSTVANRIVNPHESSIYTVVATNPNTGCVSTAATLTVNTTPVPELTINGDSAICAGQSTTLTLSDANNIAATYRWTLDNVNVGTETSLTVNPTETATYVATVTPTGATECAVSAEFTVTVNALPVVTLANSVNEFCLGDSLTVSATEVEGYTYSWNTGDETAAMTTVPAVAGNYTATLTVTETATGCVNEFTSEAVAVYPSYELNDNQSACIGMLPYTWGEMSLTDAGSYEQTFTIAHGCDSLVHLAFEIEDTAVNTTSRELCLGTEFTFGTGIYEQAYTATETGVITYVDTTSDVCAARYNLNLTVNMPATTTDEATACDTYTWNGNEYTVSGVYTDTLATTKGCDSVVTMNLTVNYSNTGVDEQIACDSYEWINGVTYTESINTPTYTLTNAGGCDSVVTLNLTVNTKTYGVDEIVYCDGFTYEWINGRSYTTNTTGVNFTLPTPNAAGCDSIVTLDLTMNPVYDTLAWRNDTALDEYAINTVSCEGEITTTYLHESGDYELRTRNTTTGADRIERIHLVINHSSYHTVFDTACAQYTWFVETYEVGTYTQSGTYSYDRGNGNIEVLMLTINQPVYDTTDTVAICKNGVWTDGNGQDFAGADYETGVYQWNTVTSTDPTKCETRQMVDLTVNEVYNIDNDVVMLCASAFTYVDSLDEYQYTYAVNDTTNDMIAVADFAAAQIIDRSFAYTAATGCDSVVNFHFTVNPMVETIQSVAACYKYTWDLNGNEYTESGFDTMVVADQYGCDSTVILDLTINSTVEGNIDTTVCMTFTWNEVTYTENQRFLLEDGLTAKNGCDSVTYLNFIVKNHQLNNQIVVANVPYTWINGQTYTESVSNIFYDVTPDGECDSVLMLTLTMLNDTLTLCESALPYETDFGYTVAAGTTTGLDNAIDEQGSGYYIYNKINATGNTAYTEHGCNSFTWTVNGEEYTEDGDYIYTYAADANGCQRVDTLHLTISAYNEVAVADTACGTYTWSLNGETYTVSGSYNDTIAAITGCDTIVTLNLVIPAGQKYEVTECYEYTWMHADSTTQVFTTSDSVGYSYVEPVSGCTVEDTLVLTINTYSTDSNTVIKNMASYTFNNVLYTAPTDTVIFDTVANPTGCDSVHITRLIVSDGVVVDVDTLYCGNFLWEDGNVYGWISGQEALQNGTIFRYKNLTTGEYVYQNPEYYVFDANGALDTTFVLWLTLAEASVDSIDYGTVLASQVSVTPVTIGDSSFYFADELAAKHDTTVVKEVRYGSAYYCDSVEYYTFHLVYNYTVEDTVILCGAETEYTWREQNWPLDGAGLTTTLTDIADAGTADEWVYSINVNQYDAVVVTDTTATACESFTWNDSTYTVSTTTAQFTYTDANGCDSTVTLNLTINYNSNTSTTTTQCYEYFWNDSTYKVAGTHLYAYNTPEGCPSVDTLYLTLTGHEPIKTVVSECDSYTWADGDQLTYTVSDSVVFNGLNSIGCEIHDTLVVTIRNSNSAEKDTLVNGTYAMIDDVMYEGRSDMDMLYDVVRHLTNEAGCDSTLTLHLTITPYRDTVINEIACGTYTWTVTGEAWTGNDHTYEWIPAAEREANNGALYRDLTANEYVYNYPSDTVGNVIYRLNLALNEAMIIDTTINFPLSQQMMTFGTENYNFAAENAAVTAASNTVAPGAFYGNPVIKTVSMGSSSHYCDSIYKLTINLVNNYYTADTAICYTTDFEWNGKHHNVPTGLSTVRDTFFVGTPDERVVAMKVNVAGYLHADTNATACDSFTWGNVEFTASGNYDSTYISPNGCDSVVTLHLTINTNNGYWDGADGDVVRCDSYDFQGNLLTESCDTTITWADDNGCEATDHFTLTIVSATPSVTDTNVCDNFHWVINNSDDTPAYDETFNSTTVFGTKHYENILGQQCWATDSLFLTVRHSSSYDSVLYISDGSYRYGDTMLMATTSFDTFEVYTNAEQCDSTLNLTFNVGTAYFLTENIISCDTFVWEGRTGDTYAWIDNDESAANGNALYKNQTTGEYVMHNPVFVKENEGDYDSIIMLRLTLTQIYTGVDDTNFNISNEILTYGDSVFDFSAMATAAENFHDTTVMREVHFGSGYYCDSVINLYINLTNNFVEVADTDICATATEVAWRGQTLSTANTEYDVAHTYHIYDTLASGIVEYMTINQHQIAYITERRTACDSYTWEETGDVFTESTTISLGGGIDNYGCPAIVNLILTVNHNSSKVTDTTVCESFVWKANNAAQTVLGTFTNDTTVTYNYTSDEGCPSTDELILVVNHNTNTVVRDTVCDSYDWTVANGEDAGTYTTSGAYWYDYTTAEGCASIDSLYLVVKYSSPATTIDTAACERLVWNDVEYISSSHYTQNLVNAAGCDSVVTINLTIGHPSVTVIDSTVCDSLVWNTVAYTVSGSYTDTLPAIGGCDSIVTINLTVNNADSRATEVVACRNYTWDLNGITYTTSGDYVVNGTNEFGCESNDTLHLTIGNNRTYSYEEVVNCGPYTWIVNGEEVGTYESDIETSATVVNPNNGCDSIIFLTLTIKEAPVVDSTYTVCESAMPFTWRDTTLNEAGTASVSFTLASGCDSTINMTLVVTPTINTVLNENVCLGLGYNNNNFDIAASELPTAGTYTFVDSLISTVTGCDSIVTLNITVGDLLTTSTEVVACVNYDWTAGNNTVYNYTESGTYFTEPYINEQGCTSVDTLVLTISQPVATTDEATACDSYNWNGTEYTVSGEYVDTLATVDGCDSIVTLTLTVNNSVTATDNAIACGSYTWNNNEYTASGDYVDTLTAANGCDSIVTLTLVINMPVASAFSETACGVYVWNDSVYNQSGTYEQTFEAENGCDSVVTLTLTVNSASTSEETVTVCDSYTWNDSVYTESGIYTYTTNNASGCDSVATLNLTVNVSTTSVDTVNACNYYEWNGTAYTTSGTYTYSATNAAGCDSTATLVLTINTPVATAISETACESYTWNNATYSTSGEYTQTFTAENGCDSVVTLSLTINNAVNASETATACNSYIWNGTEYTTSGTYTYTTTAANGCDSIVTLTLTINEPATETVNATACSSYTWNGQTYTASGIYTYNTTAANGCDSVVTLALTVNQPVNSSVTETACDSYTWNGVTYTTSGNYTYTGTAANGCDSVVTLALTINNAVATAETAEACDSYTWNGQTYTTSGTYTWTGTATTGCDSVVTLTLTVNNAATATETAEACDSYVWNGIAYAASGVYTYTTTAANGCDSVVTLNLTINQSVATTVTETAETNLVWNGVTYTESGTYYWTGTAANGCDSTVTLVLTINNSIYDTNYYTVAANIQNPGMGEVTGTGVYAEGSVVTLTATPNEGFAFMFWMCGNDTVTTNLQHTFTVVSDTTFTAVFVALPVYYTVTGVANDPAMGYVEQNPTQYEAGATAHLTAQANDGYHFVRWSNGETTPDIYFTVTCDITLTAYFEANEPVTGVEDVDMNNVTIYSNDTRIFVRGAEGFDVYVYDVNGRVMNSQANAGEVVEFRMPATGVYLVKVGNAPAKRVLVVR